MNPSITLALDGASNLAFHDTQPGSAITRTVGLVAVVFFALILATPESALAWSSGPRSSGSSRSSSSSGIDDDIKLYLVLAAIPLLVTVGGIVVDRDLIQGRFGTSEGVNYGFSIANLMLGAGVLGYGIKQREPLFILLGALPFVVGLIGLIATPIREAQRRDREDPGDITAPLRSGSRAGLGWTFALGS